MTQEQILSRLLSDISDEFDKSVGSFFYDIDKPVAKEFETLYNRVEEILVQGFAATATGAYHRYKDYCTSHRIREEDLDRLVYDELKRLRNEAENSWYTIEGQVKKWLGNKHNYENEIKQSKDIIYKLNDEIKKILMEKINDKENNVLYDEMIAERKNEIKICEDNISKLQNIDETIKKRKKELKVGIDILDGIIAEETISNANLRLLIKQIIVFEENKKLSIVFEMNAPFSGYGKMFDKNGNLLMEHDGEYNSLTA